MEQSEQSVNSMVHTKIVTTPIYSLPLLLVIYNLYNCYISFVYVCLSTYSICFLFRLAFGFLSLPHFHCRSHFYCSPFKCLVVLFPKQTRNLPIQLLDFPTQAHNHPLFAIQHSLHTFCPSLQLCHQPGSWLDFSSRILKKEPCKTVN